jgi:hypothetical protein
LNVRPDNEWTIAVLSGSCFWIASNIADLWSDPMAADVEEKARERKMIFCVLVDVGFRDKKQRKQMEVRRVSMMRGRKRAPA